MKEKNRQRIISATGVNPSAIVAQSGTACLTLAQVADEAVYLASGSGWARIAAKAILSACPMAARLRVSVSRLRHAVTVRGNGRHGDYMGEAVAGATIGRLSL